MITQFLFNRLNVNLLIHIIVVFYITIKQIQNEVGFEEINLVQPQIISRHRYCIAR